MSAPSAREQGFVSWLNALVEREDRAALAALRRGLGKPPGTVADMYPYVVPWLPAEPGWGEEAAYYLIASLFALHQRDWDTAGMPGASNLGASLQRLARATEHQESVERRFVALLNSHPDDLPDHLRHAVGLLAANDVPIDWARLLHDIQGWTLPSRAVQRQWARAFWAATSETDPNDHSTGSATV